jgi:lantibiotic modifying enzyme
VLYSPERHEPLGAAFSEPAALDAIARIVERGHVEIAGVAEHGLYDGVAGIAWALGELGSPVDRSLLEVDDGDLSVWDGAPGVLAVAERFWPDAERRDRLADYVRRSIDLPSLELMLGHPGHMLLAAQLHERTGEPRWLELWSAGAKRLLDEWRYDEELGAWLWTQHLPTEVARYVGPAHGLAGNVRALVAGGADVEQRAVETLTRLAFVEGEHANWAPYADKPLVQNDRIRVQWCHGAPGILTTLWQLAPDDELWSELLLAAGRLVWDAGPLRDAPGLCHGTAGSAYALLALWRRTGDEQWLERARALAAHAARQAEEHPRHSLLNGDEGVALCLASCLEGDADFPLVDRLV